MLQTAEPVSTTKSFDRIRRLQKPLSKEEAVNATIKDIKKGGFLEFQGTTYEVISVGLYTETNKDYSQKKKFFSVELELVDVMSGKTLWMEWEEDDEVEICVSQSRHSLREVRNEDGDVISDPWDYTDEGECLVFQGISYWYDDDWPSVYKREGQDDEDKVYMHDFESENGTCLSIEKWIDDDDTCEFQVYVSKNVRASEIQILQIGDQNGGQ
ncbi:MAG: DUF4178 domain-containing protein [Candidatus Pacebacteria bacterium]|nr:DUF4178 domain-containing protein [Candidatus Paceibacterota bacterium]